MTEVEPRRKLNALSLSNEGLVIIVSEAHREPTVASSQHLDGHRFIFIESAFSSIAVNKEFHKLEMYICQIDMIGIILPYLFFSSSLFPHTNFP